MNTICKYTIIAIIAILTSPLKGICQKTPAPNAVLLADSLVFGGATSITHATLTYNPVVNKYYSLRIGNAVFPLHTWNQSGGLSVFQDTAGIDSRGIWWNPNTSQVERNCFNTLGWSTINLDGSGNATKFFTMLFTGQHQPTQQSVGAYDYITNTVIFNSNGIIHVYDRNTGSFMNSFPLTGTSLTNINTESVIYTGQTGFEIGILDYVVKRVLFFNRATGAFAGMSQLPLSALTHNQFRFCYANEKVWLFNASLKKWNSYNIWNSPLPIELLSFTSNPHTNNKVLCKWTTATETGNNYFTLERSLDGKEFEQAGNVHGAGNSASILHYSFIDEHPYPGISYYRLKQTDFNGDYSYTGVVAVKLEDKTPGSLNIYPNPASENIFISISNTSGNEDCIFELYDMEGSKVFSIPVNKLHLMHENSYKLDISFLKSGLYFSRIVNRDEMIYMGKISVQ